MNSKLKDVIHLYIGQQLVSYWGDFKETQTIKGVIYPTVIFRYDEDDGIQDSLDISFKAKKGREPKLLLRPLSAITEQEVEQWNKISTPIGKMGAEAALQIHWSKRLNYYRSIGIDCDNLIKSGQAIDKTQF